MPMSAAGHIRRGAWPGIPNRVLAMRLHKTPKAREALASHGLVLSASERRILILCDGQRMRTAIETLLGGDTAGSIEVLIAQGYLAVDTSREAGAAPAPATSAKVAGKLAGRLFGRTRTAVPTVAPVAPQPPAPDMTAHPGSLRAGDDAQPVPMRSRRSLSAAKMYMLDMLQLQRNLEAASIAVAIQTSGSEQELAEALVEALACMCANTKHSVATRIAERLLEVLPEAQLTHVRAAWLAMTQPAPTVEPLAGNVVRLPHRGVA